MVEVAERKIAELGLDKDVLRGEHRDRGAHVLLGEDEDHLPRDAEHGSQLLARQERRAEIHRDDHVGAHLAAMSIGRLLVSPPVDEEHVADLGGSDHARHRHARAHHARKVAVAENHRPAGHKIGRDCAKRDRQIVEAAIAPRPRELPQHRLELHPGDNALLQEHFAIADADLRSHEIQLVLFLAAHRELAARRLVLEEELGGDGRDHLFHLGGRDAGRVGGAHERAHAGAGDAIDRDPVFLEHLEHADVRGATSPAAGEHDADSRALRRRRAQREREERRASDPGGLPARRLRRPGMMRARRPPESEALRHGVIACSHRVHVTRVVP